MMFFFFDTIDSEENEDDYEQIYLIHKKNGWEIIYDLDKGYSSHYKQPYDLSYDIENFNNHTKKVDVLNSIGQDQYSYRYAGSTSQNYLDQFSTSKTQHFLQIINDGLDCSLPKGVRSTFDLLKDIDFEKLTIDMHLTHENLLLNYFSYIAHRLCVLFEHVEYPYIYDLIATSNFDDSIVDMLFVLDKIKNANKKAEYPLNLNSSFIFDISNNISDLQRDIELTCDLTKKQHKEIDKNFKKLLQEINLFK